MNSEQKAKILKLFQKVLDLAKSSPEKFETTEKALKNHPGLEAGVAAMESAAQKPATKVPTGAAEKYKKPAATLAQPVKAPVQSSHPAVDLSQFHSMLDSHDWFHSESDDKRVSGQGRVKEAQLNQIAAQSPEHKAMFDGFKGHHFSGSMFGRPKSPKPIKPGL